MSTLASAIRPAATPLATRLWQVLTSMSFSVAMLFIVAVAAVAGSLVDQNQPYAVLVGNFGSLWADFYRLAGVDDVYHATWFLLLLAVLALSTGLCVARNAPRMLREMRSFKEGFAYAQVRRIQPQVELQHACGDAAAAEARMRSALQTHGYRLRAGHAAQAWPGMTARKGMARRLGYLLTHGAIVVICVGGLVDGNLLLKWQLATGALVAQTGAVPVERVGAASRLGTGAGSFRGAMHLRPHEVKDTALLTAGEGFLVRDLPFRVRLKDFRIDYHASGQPRDFVSEIELLARDGDAVLRTLRLSVNHPAEYEGVQFFQSGFDDGGTRLAVALLGGDGAPAGRADLTVGDATPLLLAGAPVQLEATAFHLRNVVAQGRGQPALARAFLQAPGKGRHLDLGPSVEVALRDAAGQALTQTSYVQPILVEGRPFFVVRASGATADADRFIRFPLDAAGSLATYRRVIGALQATAAAVGSPAGRAGEDMPGIVRRALPLIASAFLADGFRALAPAGDGGDDASTAARDVKVQLLARAALPGVLAGERAPDPAQALRFVADSLLAYSDWTELERPALVKVEAAEPLTATVLQVSHAPGRLAVVAGMACLAAGVILLVLVPERRVWVRKAPRADRVVLALAAQGTRTDLAAELERIAADFAPEWTISPRSS